MVPSAVKSAALEAARSILALAPKAINGWAPSGLASPWERRAAQGHLQVRPEVAQWTGMEHCQGATF